MLRTQPMKAPDEVELVIDLRIRGVSYKAGDIVKVGDGPGLMPPQSAITRKSYGHVKLVEKESPAKPEPLTTETAAPIVEPVKKSGKK